MAAGVVFRRSDKFEYQAKDEYGDTPVCVRTRACMATVRFAQYHFEHDTDAADLPDTDRLFRRRVMCLPPRNDVAWATPA